MVAYYIPTASVYSLDQLYYSVPMCLFFLAKFPIGTRLSTHWAIGRKAALRSTRGKPRSMNQNSEIIPGKIL